MLRFLSKAKVTSHLLLPFSFKASTFSKLMPIQNMKTKYLTHIAKSYSSSQKRPQIGAPEQIEILYCDGCNSLLQSKDKSKYGFVEEKVLQETIEGNKKNMGKVFHDKMKEKNVKMMEYIDQIEKENNVIIFNRKTNQLQNLDDLEILMKIQEKMQKYEKQAQLSKKMPKMRKSILCYRCFCLKHHNRLPEQYDYDEGFTTEKSQFLLRKVINKRKGLQNVQFFYVVDVFDILGTFQDWIFEKLLLQNVNFSIIVNKIDIVNKKYLNMTNVHHAIRLKVSEYFKKLGVQNRQINYFFISSLHKDGIKKLEKHLELSKNHIQLVGYPNTGKTTLVNLLTRLKKSTSKIPGTTVKMTEHSFRSGQNRKIYDMPGLYCDYLLYNLIGKPSQRSLLTWNKKFSPGILTHQALIFGGKVEIQGVRIIIFGNGGACSSDNRWFINNYRQFWKGLPEPSELNIRKYEIELQFNNGKSEDLEIAGYGFIGFRLCIPNTKKVQKKLTLYLPEKVKFCFRPSILSSDDKTFHNKSSLVKRFMLERVHEKPDE